MACFGGIYRKCHSHGYGYVREYGIAHHTCQHPGSIVECAPGHKRDNKRSQPDKALCEHECGDKRIGPYSVVVLVPGRWKLEYCDNKVESAQQQRISVNAVLPQHVIAFLFGFAGCGVRGSACGLGSGLDRENDKYAPSYAVIL